MPRTAASCWTIFICSEPATPPEDIVRKIGRDIPLGVEINDGTLATPVNLPDSVVNKRLLPGDGEFDIAAFLSRGLDPGL